MCAEITPLPSGFEMLAPFAERWAVAGMVNRSRLRTESTESERQAFYDAFKDLLSPALDYLDQKSFENFDASDQCLLLLTQSFAHVALAVEVQAGDESKHARSREHLIITRDGGIG